MKKMVLVLAMATMSAFAGVPVKWTVETSRADTQEVPCYHGETLDMEVTFKNYGQDLFIPTNIDAQIFWQTNGMSAFYWRTNNVTVVSNKMYTAFLPEMDPGTVSCKGFVGVPGQIYRASFVLRFKDSPGLEPKILEWPYRELDFTKVEVKNAPYYVKGETHSRAEIEAILAAYDYYASATNREETIVSNLTEWARGEFRKIEDSYTKAQIDSFIQLLQTKADAATATNTLDQTIRAWAEEEFQKSWELEEVQLGKDASATGVRTTAVGAYAEASGISSIAFGNAAEAKGNYPIAIGLHADATNGNGVAIGSYSDAANGGINIGTGGQWNHGHAYGNAIAIGNVAKANASGIAIGPGSVAGNQSIAVGRDTKATHTAAVAIGAEAQSVGDSTMRIKYAPSDIYLGFYQSKSLQQYFNELTPRIDWSIASNIVKSAEFLPSKYYRIYRGTTNETARWEWTSRGSGNMYSTTIELKPANTSSLVSMDFGDGTMATFENGGRVNIMKTGEVWIPDANVVTFGTEANQTNLTDYIRANSHVTETDPTVKSWAKAATKPTYSAAEVGAYSAANGNTLATQVSTIGAHLNAEDARFVSTNYNSLTKMPEAYVEVKQVNQTTGSNEWLRVWSEMTRWNKFAGADFDWTSWNGFHTWRTNIAEQIAQTSPKEYAFYDGVTGEVAPDGFFWIAQPRVAVCAGMGYQRYMDAGGTVWILESNGMVANANGTTNGYFRISDEEGNSQFEIIKGDKQTVGATAYSMRSETVMGVVHRYVEYAVTNALAAPTAKFCRNLSSPTWIADTEANCPCNVTWTPGVNSYTLEFWPKATEPQMFVKAEYDRGGETRIKNSVPTEMQYIILNGTKYQLVPKTVGGELVMGLVAE